MSKAPIDPERLAALIDHKLSDAERSAVLAQLAAADDDTFAAFADASALSAEAAPAGVATRRRDFRTVFQSRSFLAAAAVLIAAVVIVPRVTRVEHSESGDPSRFAALLPDQHAAVAPTQWPAARGGDAARSDLDRRSARIGVRLTDLFIAARARDASAPALAREVADLLSGVPLAGAVKLEYDSLATQLASPSSDAVSLVRRASEAAANVGNADVIRLAAWLEAARVAAASQDVRFFSDNVPPGGGSALDRVRSLSHEPAGKWPDLSRALDDAILALVD